MKNIYKLYKADVSLIVIALEVYSSQDGLSKDLKDWATMLIHKFRKARFTEGSEITYKM